MQRKIDTIKTKIDALNKKAELQTASSSNQNNNSGLQTNSNTSINLGSIFKAAWNVIAFDNKVVSANFSANDKEDDNTPGCGL